LPCSPARAASMESYVYYFAPVRPKPDTNFFCLAGRSLGSVAAAELHRNGVRRVFPPLSHHLGFRVP
jgi:hypothetical protein